MSDAEVSDDDDDCSVVEFVPEDEPRAEPNPDPEESLYEQLRREERDYDALVKEHSKESAKVQKTEACDVCETWLSSEDNSLLMCDARLSRRTLVRASGATYTEPVLCNRMRHVWCAGLDDVPEGRWFCSAECESRDEAYDRATAARRSKRKR